MSESESFCQVLIIGAGISGLSAAQTLTKLGVKVRILEAKPVAGGRVASFPGISRSLDMGASFLHGGDENPLRAHFIQEEMNLAALDEDAITALDGNGNILSANVLDAGYKEYRQILRDLDELQPRDQHDLSVADGLEQLARGRAPSALAQFYLDYDLSWSLGSTLDDVSWRYGANDEDFEGMDLLPMPSFMPLVEKLKARLDLRLNCKVSHCRFRGDGVEVVSNQGTVFAEKVLITVPLGVLKAGVMQFDPPLPLQKLGAIKRLGMGRCEKLVGVFERCFWDKTQHIFAFLPKEGVAEESGRFPVMFSDMPHSGQPILRTFGFSQYAKRWQSLRDEEILDDFFYALARLDLGAPKPTSDRQASRDAFIKHWGLKEWSLSRWGEDPDVLGAYSYAHRGCRFADFEVLAKPVKNRLFFAGEATSQKHRGTLHGAFFSGERAANEIFESLKASG